MLNNTYMVLPESAPAGQTPQEQEQGAVSGAPVLVDSQGQPVDPSMVETLRARLVRQMQVEEAFAPLDTVLEEIEDGLFDRLSATA